MSKAKVSIIIPTYNEEAHLPILLECLENQTYKDFEIIVADANSKDITRKIARDFGAKVVDGGIPSVGRNNGAKVATGDVFVFIDADVTFNNTFLENALDSFKKRKLDFATPYYNINVKKFSHRSFFVWGNAYKRFMRYTRFPDGTGQLAIVKKDKFNEIGGYPNYIIGEDTELFWKAARSKYKVGTIKENFNSSVRRIEKVGIFWLLLTFSFIGIFLMIGKGGDKVVQSLGVKLYGGLGKAK
ncbi:glycosyltransferase [Candidatus Dojkabacteria bacterium]|uniref:Glycosyltransferase n=1 Tax=Candidatus Dojkabacteria bacterium TaxID=2099670 RepID=A0A955L2H6_9BACT|nr:glycosyltransferase [Candidatus Dojkabacteria bacterium]